VLKGFFDEWADALLDDLVCTVFPKHMKIMENYYPWVSRLYARAFGRPSGNPAPAIRLRCANKPDPGNNTAWL
jgi:hypothetical protein